MSRRRAREIAFLVLFQVDIGRIPWREALTRTQAEHELPPDGRRFAGELVEGTVKKLPELDEILSELAVDWPLHRMLGTDRNILRLAAYEILYREDIPVEVSVNEAVELAKVYGDENSGRFVNGILGSLIKKYHNPKAQTEEKKKELNMVPPKGGQP